MTLSDQVEAATGADRELDALIFVAVNGYEKRHNERLGFDQYWKDGRWVGLGSMPPYSTSIDAALTLVMKGWDWLKCLDERGHTIFAVYAGDGAELGRSIYTNSDVRALCAAALRARGL